MEFKKGFKVKPSEIQTNGEVLFTDGTDTFTPNQVACEAYGYDYDSQLGVCKAYNYTSKLAVKIKENKILLKGTNNRSEKGVSDTFVSGKDNTLKGENRNCFISGEKNKVNRRIDNTTVLGKMGNASHVGEVVIGGGGFNSEAGLLQYSILQASAKTTTVSDETKLFIYGETDLGQITLPSNSITTYEIWLSGLITGGSGRGATAGNYETMEYHGAIRTINNGTMTHNAKISRLLGRTGSLGSITIDTSIANTLGIKVAGLEETNIQWHAVVKLHINKTNAVEIT